MNKKKKLKICDICLLVAMVLVLASSVQMEACGGRGLGAWDFPMLMYLHCILGIGMFVLVGIHLYLHFGKNRWHEKIKRLKSQPTKFLCRLFFFMLFLSIVAFVVTMARPKHGLIGAIHGKVGFLFILFCIPHTIKRWKWIKGA